ncbi:hypothetical protein [Sciscionella marina]|uniref:hypothetical protein n=1 Tax=Sciscionella marina TaxID=508770 RepID=UPI00037D1CF2|nr:hypothetical protein [Sciscionella marina]
MNTRQQARRIAAATLGAADWLQEQFAQAWQDRASWTGRADEFYSELARRGEDVLTRTGRAGRRQARKARETARRIPGFAPVEGEAAGLTSNAEDLPIADYNSFNVEQLLPQLPPLSQRELHQVEGYEAEHQARTTVLRRIDELRGTEPWPAYDEMTVDEIVPRLRELSPNQRSAVATYEQRHKQRRTIIDAAEPNERAT